MDVRHGIALAAACAACGEDIIARVADGGRGDAAAPIDARAEPVERPLLEDGRPWALAVDDVGVVVAGEFQSNIFVLELDASGGLNPAFGQGGLVAMDLRGPFSPQLPELSRNHDEARVVKLTPDFVYVAGQGVGYDRGHLGNMAVVRLTRTGNVDSSFGQEGVVVVEAGAWTRAEDLVLDDAGRLYVVGTLELPVSGRRDFVILRLLPDGRLDPSFASPGRPVGVVIDVGDDDNGVVGALFGDRLIVGGGTNFTLVQVDVDGLRQTDFGRDGVFRQSPGRMTAGAVVPEGLIAAGLDQVSAGGPFVKLVCSGPDGDIVACPGVPEVTRIPVPGPPESIRAVVPEPSGALSILVTIVEGNRAAPFVLRLTADGSPDPAHGVDGWLRWDVPLARLEAAGPAASGRCGAWTADGPIFCGYGVAPTLTRPGAVVGRPAAPTP